MKDIEIYDKDNGWDKITIFEPHEIVALQMAGVPDDEITSIYPDLHFDEQNIDRRFGQHTFITYNERKRQAKERLAKFWRRDTEDQLIHLVRSTQSLYWVETSATLSKVFRRLGGIPVPSTMVKYLLNGEMVTPAHDGFRYMHPNEETAKHSAWKTMFLLPSLAIYDAAYKEFGGKEKYEITNAADAVKVFDGIYEWTFEDQVYERFIKWSYAIRRASWFLQDDRDNSINEYEKAETLSLIDYYMSDFNELEIHTVPRKYLNTVEDECGVIFDETMKRVVGVNKEKFLCESYTLPTTVEYLDDNVFWCQKSLKHIDLGNVRMIGDNQFLQSSLVELTIPESIESVGGCLCEGCKSLTRVEFKNSSLEYLDIACFNGCSALSEIILPQDLIGLSDNVLANTMSLKSIILPKTLRYIGGECFMNTGLESIELPSSIMEVAEDAFLRREGIKYQAACPPDYNNIPLSMVHPMPGWMFIERFQECWIKQLLKYYSYIVNASLTGQRAHELDSYRAELKRCLKWLNAVGILPDFPFYTLTMALTTEDTDKYNDVYLYLTIGSILVREDWISCPKDKLRFVLSFKSQLQQMYELIEDGTSEDIEKYVDSLGQVDEITQNDMMSFVDKCKENMSLFSEPINPDEIPNGFGERTQILLQEITKSRSKVTMPLTYAWADGPTLTTTRGCLEDIIEKFQKLTENE